MDTCQPRCSGSNCWNTVWSSFNDSITCVITWSRCRLPSLSFRRTQSIEMLCYDISNQVSRGHLSHIYDLIPSDNKMSRYIEGTKKYTTKEQLDKQQLKKWLQCHKTLYYTDGTSIFISRFRHDETFTRVKNLLDFHIDSWDWVICITNFEQASLLSIAIFFYLWFLYVGNYAFNDRINFSICFFKEIKNSFKISERCIH